MQFLKRLRVSSIDELGRCLFCVRAAFLAAFCAWGAAFAVMGTAPGLAVGRLLTVVALALTTLWLTHLTAFAMRAARSQSRKAAACGTSPAVGHTRRALIASFAKAFAGIAMASAFLAFSRAASADDECPAGTPSPCGTQYCCAAPAKYYCQGYTGTSEPWRSMGSFCTNSDSDEDVANLRSNCAILVVC